MNYSVKVYFVSNVRLNAESSQVVQAIMIHGGPEIICDELTLTEASIRCCYCGCKEHPQTDTDDGKYTF